MAASARIVYTPTSLGGSHLAAAARYTILAKQEIDRAAGIAAAITNNGVDNGNLDSTTEFGQNATGTGATLYAFITGFQTLLANIPDSQLAKLDQG
jgi:hypothetical protein